MKTNHNNSKKSTSPDTVETSHSNLNNLLDTDTKSANASIKETSGKLINLVERIEPKNSELTNLVERIEPESFELIQLVERIEPEKESVSATEQIEPNKSSDATLPSSSETLIELVTRINNDVSENNVATFDTSIANKLSNVKPSTMQQNNKINNETVDSNSDLLNQVLSSGGKLLFTEEFENNLSYYVTHNCWFCHIHKNTLQQISNFTLNITHEEIQISDVIDEENTVVDHKLDLFWEIELRILSSEKIYTAKIPNAKIKNVNSYVPEVTDSRGIIVNSSLLSHYIALLIISENYPHKKVFTTPGWKYYQNRWIFVTNLGNLGSTKTGIRSNGSYQIFSPNKALDDSIAFEEFWGMRGIIPNKPENAVILQYFGLIGTLTSLFQQTGFPIKFSVATIGKTNSKKTSCSTIFTRFYKRKEGMQPDLNFKSTEIAIFEAMANCADSVLIVDDLVPPESPGQSAEQAKKAEAIVRSYGDRIPRKRSEAYAKANGISAYTPITGCCLMTGEIWTGCKSSQSRVLKLEFDDNDVDNEILLHYQANLHSFTSLYLLFLGYVEDHIDEVLTMITSTLRSARLRAPQAIGLITPRFNETYGDFEAIMNVFAHFAIDMGFWRKDEAHHIITNDLLLILKVLQENDRVLQTLSPGSRIVLALQEAVNSGTLDWQFLEDLDETFVYHPQDYIMFENDDYIYIRSEILWQISQKYFREHQLFFDYRSGRDLIQPLKSEGLIEVHKEGPHMRSSVKVTLGKSNRQERFLRLKKTAIATVLDYNKI